MRNKHSLKNKITKNFLLVMAVLMVLTLVGTLVPMLMTVNMAEETFRTNMEEDISQALSTKADRITDMVNTHISEVMNVGWLLGKYLYEYCNGDSTAIGFDSWAEAIDANEEIIIPPPSDELAGSWSFKRYLANSTITSDQVLEELLVVSSYRNFLEETLILFGHDIEAAYYASKSGLLIVLDRNWCEGDGIHEQYYNYYNKQWYQNGLSAIEYSVSDTYEDIFSGQRMITLSAPVYFDNRLTRERTVFGVYALDITLASLFDNVVSMNTTDDMEEYLLDARGNIILSENILQEENEGYVKDIHDEACEIHEAAEFVDEAVSGETMLRHIGNNYYFIREMQDTTWTYVICVPDEKISSKVNEMKATVFSAIAVLLLVFTALSALGAFLIRRSARQITIPLIQLTRDAELIATGKLSHRSQVVTDDEVGLLSDSFNRMTESLNSYIANLTQVTAEKERIGAELSVAASIQASMLPSVFPPFPDRDEFSIYAMMHPAKEVGGDFYDFFFVDESHFAMVVADVSGKGVPASLFMTIAKTLIHAQTLSEGNLGEGFATVNELMCENNAESLFVTAFEAVIDLRTGDAVYVNAGHDQPFLRHGDGDFEALNIEANMALAAFPGLSYGVGHFHMEPGDQYFQYTDGVPEAINEREEQFGMDRLRESLNQAKGQNPEQVIDTLRISMADFVGKAEQFDDITVLCFNYIKKMTGEENGKNEKTDI